METTRTAPASPEAGFTIIELVFVFVIFAIMSTIVLFNFRAFNAKIQFENLTQDIALRIVEAQKASISGATNVNFLAPSSKPTYGVFFQAAAAASPESTRFTYFNDIAPSGASGALGNKLYDPPAGGGCPVVPTIGNECLSVTTITSGEFVSGICYVAIGDTVGTCPIGAEAHISFTRPFPDANIMISTSGSAAPLSVQAACVELTSGDDPLQKRTITVTNLGSLHTVIGAATSAESLCHP